LTFFRLYRILFLDCPHVIYGGKNNMDLKQKIIMATEKREAYRFMKYCEKAKKLMPKANTRKKK